MESGVGQSLLPSVYAISTIDFSLFFKQKKRPSKNPVRPDVGTIESSIREETVLHDFKSMWNWRQRKKKKKQGRKKKKRRKRRSNVEPPHTHTQKKAENSPGATRFAVAQKKKKKVKKTRKFRSTRANPLVKPGKKKTRRKIKELVRKPVMTRWRPLLSSQSPFGGGRIR